MHRRTRDGDFFHTTPTISAVFPAGVAGSLAGHLLVDLARMVTWVAVLTELVAHQQAEWHFGLESVWLRPKTAAFGVQRLTLLVSAYAKSRSQRILLC